MLLFKTIDKYAKECTEKSNECSSPEDLLGRRGREKKRRNSGDLFKNMGRGACAGIIRPQGTLAVGSGKMIKELCIQVQTEHREL